MAINFRTNTAVAPSNRPETKGYINAWLPRQNGKAGKVGAIRMVPTNAAMAALIDELENGTPERRAEILSAIRLEYNSVTPQEGSEFAI